MFQAITRHGILVTVALLILCVLGTMAALRIPVQMIPDLETRTVTVETRWPGATPQDIEKETGLGSVLFLATTADRDWSNLVVHPLFPMIMQQTITHLTNRLAGPPFTRLDRRQR